MWAGVILLRPCGNVITGICGGIERGLLWSLLFVKHFLKLVPICPFFHAIIKLGLLVLRNQRLYAGSGGGVGIISAAANIKVDQERW